MKSKLAVLTFALAGVAMLGCSGCGDNEGTGLTGRIPIDGSSTVEPMTSAATDEFRETYEDIDISVGTSGTGGGFEKFSAGETDISDASRPIKLDEFQECTSNGIEFIELPVAYDGLTFVVHKDNQDVNQLTIDQLKRIFLKDGGANNWSDLDPNWPDEPIKIYAPGSASGTYDYAKEVFGGDDVTMRSDMTTSEIDKTLVDGVAGNTYAIGFFGFAYYYENQDKLKAVPIVNPELGVAVTPSHDTITSGEYAPFSRPLFIYVKVASASRPEVSEFVTFYLNNAAKIASSVKYVPVPDEIYETAKSNFRRKFSGTHFLAPDGSKRKGPLAEVFVSDNRITSPPN